MLEVVRRAERAWRDGAVPIASAEGFIRQILGWREYVRGMYWHLMPALRTANALNAKILCHDGSGPRMARHTTTVRPRVPRARCVASQIQFAVRDYGRVHHIARLMVQCNFATLLGVEPAALSRWYWSALLGLS